MLLREHCLLIVAGSPSAASSFRHQNFSAQALGSHLFPPSSVLWMNHADWFLATSACSHMGAATWSQVNDTLRWGEAFFGRIISFRFHTKDLPWLTCPCLWSQLEEELKARIEMWEQEHSKAFVVNGQKFMEYVTEQWEMHRLEKERAKQERVSEPDLGSREEQWASSPESARALSWLKKLQLMAALFSSGYRHLHCISGPSSAPIPELLSFWDLSFLPLTFTQQLKNKKQTETEMLYGSTPRTPNKRRGLAPSTPGKVRKVRRSCPNCWTLMCVSCWVPD